ncbi:citrate lyase subunit beta/citryl-CoA lyase [Isoptericola jiangsuensis]|uniref:Citrate lyase subunit beta/citryl-CoA lyase n=1 Tax=Isoptericola jiangsuensis TaxID=548579 RepID=A0A2A9ET34_9MICO|nr:CoA ester lyase [Isoptericola jiangsuensis]PFG42058.1 citrate lyase subunit beta/citryl-CoA lyase [Isoptericola jiangsuensis]
MTVPAFTGGPAVLFCPADRPDRYARAAASADVVVLDLEDGVGADDKDGARRSLRANPLDPARTVVRVNPAGSPHHGADLDALADTDYTCVMLPKADGRFVGPLLRHDGVPYAVVALCETATGVLAAPALAARPDVVALAWGAEDLFASLGGTSSRGADGRYRDVARHARSAVLLAGRAAGKPVLDAVHLALDDADGLREEAEDAAACGFAGTLCVHPAQVPVVRAAFAPSEVEVEQARALLAAAERTSSGVLRHDGRMIDAPLLAHARAVLARAGLDRAV